MIHDAGFACLTARDVVEVGVVGQRPFEPVQVAACVDDRAAALDGGLRERAGAEPAERRCRLRRGRGDHEQLAVAAA